VNDSALIARLTARLDDLEAQVAIRAVMADYMRLCDRLDATTPMDKLGDLFTEDARWIGKGARYGAAFGAHQGRAAILAMLGSYRMPPHFAFNAHFLTSEKIRVAGAAATGEWMMLQTATYADGRSDLRSARLTVEFSRQTTGWRIQRFATENLFSRAVDRWDDAAPVPVPASAPTSMPPAASA
jgi:ketosteroid isomerase-like protein